MIVNYKMLLCALLLLVISNFSRANLFLAMSDMEDLLNTEKAVIDGLQQYIKFEEQKLLNIKLKINEYQREYDENRNNSRSDVMNPINAYLLTKHLTNDWPNVEKMIADSRGQEIIENVVHNDTGLKFPTLEDLDGAVTALYRLQKVYNLSAHDISMGMLNGAQFKKELSAFDCFRIGRAAYNESNYKRSIHWMTISLEKLSASNSYDRVEQPITKARILSYLAFSVYKEGDVRTALNLTKTLVALDPSDKDAKNNIYFYEKEINETTNGLPVQAADLASKNFDEHSMVERYEILCRGDEQPTPAEQRHLSCRYVNNGVPFLMLGPIKFEEVLFDPVIGIYHDVIYQSEIETVKLLAKPKLKRAGVFGEAKPKIRVSKTSWLDKEDASSVQNLVRRAGFMTNLNMKSSEPLQICNYGIGGHYEPHLDYSENKNDYEWDRVATIMFYMSDVQQGGATVFPDVRRYVLPQKGSAVFWYNFKPTGEADERTRHAGCPVLIGHKWVANLWIHQPEQTYYIN